MGSIWEQVEVTNLTKTLEVCSHLLGQMGRTGQKSHRGVPLLRAASTRAPNVPSASDKSVKITMPYRSGSVPAAGSASIRSRGEEAGQPQSNETAVASGCDVGKPCNLVKRVTVE